MGLNHPVIQHKLSASLGEDTMSLSPPKRAQGAIAKYRLDDPGPVGEDGPASSSGEEVPPSGDTARILNAISLCQATLMSRIEELKVDISLIRQDLHRLRERVNETECGIGQVKDDTPPLQFLAGRPSPPRLWWSTRTAWLRDHHLVLPRAPLSRRC